MKNEELNVWKQRILRAEGVQSKQHTMWADSLDLYNCDFFDNKFGGFDPERVDVHFVNWYINNTVPLVYFRDPFIFVKERGDNYGAFAETMEKVVNIYWKELKLKQQFKRAILSTCIMPPGWIKVGYTAKIGEDISKLEEIKQKNLIADLKDMVKGVFKKEEKVVTPEEQGVLNEYIEEESIFATWISSWKMLMPEGYHLISDMPYLIEIEDISRIDFNSNPLYKNKSDIKASRDLTINGNAGGQLRKPNWNDVTRSPDSETDIIRLYHIQDRRSRKNITLSFQADDAHYESDWPESREGFDYLPLVFDETLPGKETSNPYPSNLIKPILPQIIEQSMARTQMGRWRRRSSTLILAQKGLATEEDLKQLEDTDEVQIVNVSNLGAFQISNTGAMPPQIFEVDNVIKEDLQMGTNMGQLMFQSQPGQRTATQASIGQSGLQLKASARVDVIEDFTVEVARKICKYAWEYHDRDKIKELIGEEVTQDMWPDLPKDLRERKRIINSELGFRIDAGSTSPPKDETVDKKQLLDFLSFAASFAPEMLKKVEVLKAGIKRWKFVKDLDKIIYTNDEGEILAAQKENVIMENGLPATVSPNENHMIHIGEHAKSQKKTPQLNQHMVEHGNFLGIKNDNQSAQQGSPQEGDIRSPMQSTNPEMTRQAPPTTAGLASSVNNAGVGSGKEAM